MNGFYDLVVINFFILLFNIIYYLVMIKFYDLFRVF